MGCADIGSGHNRPRSIKPEGGKLCENSSAGPSKDACDVLQQHDSRSNQAYDPDEIEKQAASSAVESCLMPCD